MRRGLFRNGLASPRRIEAVWVTVCAATAEFGRTRAPTPGRQSRSSGFDSQRVNRVEAYAACACSNQCSLDLRLQAVQFGVLVDLALHRMHMSVRGERMRAAARHIVRPKVPGGDSQVRRGAVQLSGRIIVASGVASNSS